MKKYGIYIGETYPTLSNADGIWIAANDTVEIIKETKEGCYCINVLNRTCETNRRNREMHGYDWQIPIEHIVFLQNNKLEIE